MSLVGTSALRSVSICQFADGYKCHHASKRFLAQIAIPAESCIYKDCSHCIVSNRTYLLNSNMDLIEPETFILRNSKENSTDFYCLGLEGLPCDCIYKHVCSGQDDDCQYYVCPSDKNCQCYRQQGTQLIHKTSEEVLQNPSRITFQECIFDMKRPHLARRLLEKETAVFRQHNLTISFEDPVLHLPDQGRVILRTDDYEHIILVPKDNMIVLPFELLAFPNTITVIYLHPRGLTVTGNIHVAGKSICRLKQCFFCTEVLRNFKCLPKTLQYVIYGTLITISAITIVCLKLLLKSLLYIILVCTTFFRLVFRTLKGTARGFLLLGSFFGHSIRHVFLATQNFLERHAQTNIQGLISPAIFLCIIFCFANVSADCNTQSIVQSELRACEKQKDATQICQLFTTAELTLPTIHSQTCLIFVDKDNRHLFSLKLRLDAVQCSFNTQREYFTFPVKAKHISQVSCIFNKFCGKGLHCKQSTTDKNGLRFEAETPESRLLPGVSSCVAGQIGNGCFILTRAACNFRRTFYEPDLFYAYEVSSITGHKCRYQLSLEHLENNTVTRLSLTDTVFAPNGVKVTLLGAYDQPQLHLTEKLIQRVGNPSEAYFTQASERNLPHSGWIGMIQANTSYTKEFIFDPDITQCDFFEDVLRCQTVNDPLQALRHTKETLLPLQRDFHLFQIKDGNLISSMLVTSAIRIQLYFANYKLSVESVTVCPNFDNPQFEVKGCYRCNIFARLTFRAHSTCQSGMVLVNFQDISVHTKAITLQIKAEQITIKFLAENKCYKDKLCLKSNTIVQCQELSFCLEEPSFELRKFDANFTTIESMQTSHTWWEWFKFPTLDASYFFMKLIGSGLFIICISITIFSTLITCCCRAK